MFSQPTWGHPKRFINTELVCLSHRPHSSTSSQDTTIPTQPHGAVSPTTSGAVSWFVIRKQHQPCALSQHSGFAFVSVLGTDKELTASLSSSQVYVSRTHSFEVTAERIAQTVAVVGSNMAMLLPVLQTYSAYGLDHRYSWTLAVGVLTAVSSALYHYADTWGNEVFGLNAGTSRTHGNVVIVSWQPFRASVECMSRGEW